MSDLIRQRNIGMRIKILSLFSTFTSMPLSTAFLSLLNLPRIFRFSIHATVPNSHAALQDLQIRSSQDSTHSVPSRAILSPHSLVSATATC